MKLNRFNARQRRLVISVIIFVFVAIIYLLVNPDNLEFNLPNIVIAIALAVSVAQPIVSIVDAIYVFFTRKNEEVVSLDLLDTSLVNQHRVLIDSNLRDAVLANQYRVWIDGIFNRAVENDPLIVPYEEIKNIQLDKNNKLDKFQFQTDVTFSEKIYEKITSRTGRIFSRQKSKAAFTTSNKKIEDAFVASGGQLVILGAGGSGKTIALLQLFQYLYSRAKKDPKEYIPVLFNLGLWEERQLNLTDWLVREILDTFKSEIPEGLSTKLAHEVKRQRMVFLFDGLDEISKSGRLAFYDDLIEFAGKVTGHSVQFVICSRPEEYAEIQSYYDGKQLIPKAILLRPIDDTAILQFLNGDDYQQIRKLIFGKDDKTLQRALASRKVEQPRKNIRKITKLYEPAHHPFILNALAVAYKNPPEREIINLETALKEDIHLLEADGLYPIPDVIMERYVSQRFDNAPVGGYETYPEEITNDYLSWIAQKLNENLDENTKDENKAKGSISVENLQPTWLDTDYWRLAYFTISRILGAVAITVGEGFFLAGPFDYLLPGMLVGLVVGLLDYVVSFNWVKEYSKRIGAGRFRLIRFLVVLLASWMTLSIFLGLTIASPSTDKVSLGSISIALSGITLAWFLSIFIAVIYITREVRLKLGDIEPAELIQFELGAMTRYGLVGGLSVGAFIAAFAQLLLSQKNSSTALWLTGFTRILNIGWVGGAAAVGFLVGAFFGGLFAGVFGLLSVSSFQEYERTRPSQGIRKSILNALRVGLSLTIVFSGIFYLPLWFTYHQPDVVFRAIRDGLTIGILGGLWSGGISTIHHIVLRFFLFVSGRTPWNISRFFHYCSQIGIMREIGASYSFGHNYVRQYYSKEDVPPARPRWSFSVLALAVFISTFGLGSLKQSISKSLYSFEAANQYNIAGFETLKKICVQSGQKVVIQSRGLIRTGDYVGYVSPEGTEIGMFGFVVGNNFNLDYARDLPNNALICKLDTENIWRVCAERPKDKENRELAFPMPWDVRESSFVATQNGCLQFDINEIEKEKRKGFFSVLINIEPNNMP